MALTTAYRYRSPVLNLPSGQILELPGSSVFQMPHSPGAEIDIYDIDTTQKYPKGTKLKIDDNVFRYIEFGGTITRGRLAQAEAPAAAHDDLDPTGTGTGASVAAGSKIISIADSLTIGQDAFAGGLMVIEADTGAGHAYFIESNEAVSGAANMLIRIKIGLAAALDATSDVKIIKSRWSEVIIAPTTLTGQLAGVPVSSGADGEFGWMCTKGPWAVLTNGTVVIGESVVPSGTTAGAVDALDRDVACDGAVNTPIVGIVADVGATTELSVINLMLDN